MPIIVQVPVGWLRLKYGCVDKLPSFREREFRPASMSWQLFFSVLRQLNTGTDTDTAEA